MPEPINLIGIAVLIIFLMIIIKIAVNKYKNKKIPVKKSSPAPAFIKRGVKCDGRNPCTEYFRIQGRDETFQTRQEADDFVKTLRQNAR